MSKESIFFYSIAGIFFISTIIEGVRFIIMNKKIRSVIGTIVEIKQVLPDTMKVANSKWAAFNYCIDGTTYISENRIVVPMSAQVGDKRKVQYIVAHPQKLYSLFLGRLIGLLAVTIVCALIGYCTHIK